MYKNILFDLDGTLTDPMIGITNSVIHSLKYFGIVESDRTKLYKFIGPPLVESYMKYYGFDIDKANLAVDKYREYFSVTGLYENDMYKDVDKMLCELKARGKRLILATSKPEIFAVKILQYFDLYKYFDFVAGATMDSERSKKADVIRYATQCCGITDLGETVMIGDREQDVFGAKSVGIDSVGVTYGYGDFSELKNAGATFIINSVSEILDIIK